MVEEKYALFDTDFISKMHLIRKDEENYLIDRIMEMPNYRFYCHEQIRAELARHNIAGSLEWLENNISSSRVTCYGDENILENLECIYGDSSYLMYAQLLQTACEAYHAGYFALHFPKIAGLDYRNISRELFLESLEEDEMNIGTGNNLGEIKTYVLLKALKLKYDTPIYIFCSDDRNARSGIISIGGVKCISVLTSFIRLQEEIHFQREDAEPYIQSFLRLCDEKNQVNFKVQENSKERRLCKVPCHQVLDEIYEGKFEESLTGTLKYKE
ncbi:MAG: hypothetical protein SPF99_04790 [Anaerobutyricum sp.]|nr:hypothetical protein [Anaerobutyricum sp.]